MTICQATLEDISGIFELHRLYHNDTVSDEDRPSGFVTTNFTEKQMHDLIAMHDGVTIAKGDDGSILAYATAAPWSFWAEWPLFTYMIERLNEYKLSDTIITLENSYQYGPVCVHSSVRGTGVFEQVFYASLANMEQRYPIMATFINQINGRSYAAHTRKVPMTLAGTFQFNNNNYYLMACPTSLKPQSR